MIKVLGLMLALGTVLSSPAVAGPKKMTNTQLDMVVAAGAYTTPIYDKKPETDCGSCLPTKQYSPTKEYCPEKGSKSKQPKGNNGWGNGPDSTNPGSFSGRTAPSKSTNSSVPSAGKINTAPQARFTGR